MISAEAVIWSQGISSATGPGRPDSISWKARAVRCEAGLGCSMRSTRFEQAAQGGELVGQFMQLSAAAADHHAGHLAGEAEDRGVDTPGGGQRGAGVQHAWAEHHRIGRGIWPVAHA